MHLPDQFRSTSFRLGLGYTLLLLVSVVLILGVTYFKATSEVDGIVRRSIDEDMGALNDAWTTGGLKGLSADIARRSNSVSDDRFYLLT
ncbi:MAG: two-component sensor histidine kinase, partial [Alphaproteobacteria bacterium]